METYKDTNQAQRLHAGGHNSTATRLE